MLVNFNNNLIHLSQEDTQNLSDLKYWAESVTPLLKSALAERLSSAVYLQSEHPQLLAKALCFWFENLFHYFEPKDPGRSNMKPLVSIQLLIACLDIFLDFGFSIASNSPDPYKATRSFHKAFSIRIFEHQVNETVSRTLFHEMCLLD